jgi:hypothetical protein
MKIFFPMMVWYLKKTAGFTYFRRNAPRIELKNTDGSRLSMRGSLINYLNHAQSYMEILGYNDLWANLSRPRIMT